MLGDNVVGKIGLRAHMIALAIMATYGGVHAEATTSMSRTYVAGTNLVASETRDGVVTLFTYTAAGDLETRTDARGYVTRYSDYKRGIPRKEVRAEGKKESVTITREVDDLGCVTSETDGESNTVVYGRDASCRLTSITPARTSANGTTIAYVPYSGSTPETHVRIRGNFKEEKKFDGFGRLIERTAGGLKRVWSYDVMGRLTFESYAVETSGAATLGTSFAYDELGRRTKITHADGTYVSYGYQASSTGEPQTKITDERGNVVVHTFRAFGSPENAELMMINTPVAAADIRIKRNVRGQVTEVKQGGFTRSYGYDTRYYLTTVVNPETGTTTYERDGLNNVTAVKVGDAGVTYFDLDGLSQIYAIRYPSESTRNVSRTWYKDGRRKSASNGVSTWSWSYDANGNLIQEVLDVGPHGFVTGYAYDGNDQLMQISYPKKGSVLDLAPDVLGRPTKVGGFVNAIDYHPSGLIKSMTYGNGVVTNVSVDDRKRPKTMSAGRGGGSSYVGLSVDYDGSNNVIGVADSANSHNNRSYGYDGIERIVSVTQRGETFPIAYDGAGNITKQQSSSGVLNYTYDGSSNRLISTSGLKVGAYSYDSRGNVTSNGSTEFRYDENSRLICAKCGAGDEISYGYDALGMRLSRTKGGQTSYQVYSGNDMLVEFNPMANQRQEHIYLGGHKIATNTQPAFFATGVSLAVSAANVAPGQTVTLTATVSGRTPDGVVNFYSNDALIGSGTVVNGRATLTTAALPFGYHNFKATYVGDGSNASSQTAAATRVESGQVTATIMGIINSLLLED